MVQKDVVICPATYNEQGPKSGFRPNQTAYLLPESGYSISNQPCCFPKAGVFINIRNRKKENEGRGGEGKRKKWKSHSLRDKKESEGDWRQEVWLVVGNVLSANSISPQWGTTSSGSWDTNGFLNNKSSCQCLRACYALVLSLSTFPRILLILQQSHFGDEEIEVQTMAACLYSILSTLSHSQALL